MDGVSDAKLLQLTDAIGDSVRLAHLAQKLGFSAAEIDAFRKSNHVSGKVTFNGTLDLLIRWRDKTRSWRQRGDLKEALEGAELAGIADSFFPDGLVHTKPHVRTSTGDTAIIPCHVTFEPRRVSWSRQDDEVTTVAVYQDGSFELAGDHRITMDTSFALTIRNVSESDAASYTCRVTAEGDLESTSSTKLSVVDPRIVDLRRKIDEYKVGSLLRYPLTTDVITLGVFGSVAAGKSAFINSMKFAITGHYEKVAMETAMTDMGGHVREAIKLTESIEIIDNQAIQDFDPWSHGSVQDQFAQVVGKRGRSPGETLCYGTAIHCPIFVLKSTHTDLPLLRDDVGKYIKAFSQKVFCHYGHHIVLVVTHKHRLESRISLDRLKDDLHRITHVPKDNVWIVDNYSSSDSRKTPEEDSERTVEFLEILLKCLRLAEKNIRGRMMVHVFGKTNMTYNSANLTHIKVILVALLLLGFWLYSYPHMQWRKAGS